MPILLIAPQIAPAQSAITSVAQTPMRLELREAIAEGLSRSPTARALRAEAQARRIQNERERPVARPTADAKLSGTAQSPRVTFPKPDYSLATVLPEGFVRLELIVEQTIYRPGLGAARSRYRALTAASEQEERKALGEIALSITNAYADVMKAEKGLAAAAKGRDSANDYVVLTEKRVEAGFAAPVEISKAREQRSTAETEFERAKGGLDLAKMNLNRLLGRSVDSQIAPADPILSDILADAQTLERKALAQRPEIQLIDANLKVAQAGASLAMTQIQPQAVIRGTAVEQTPTAFLPGTYLSATFEIRMPLFDGGKAKSDRNEALAQATRLKALKEEAETGILIDVKSALERVRIASLEYQSALAALDGARDRALVAQIAAKVGKGTYAEARAADRETEQAELKVETAKIEQWLAQALVSHAVGDDLPASTPAFGAAK